MDRRLARLAAFGAGDTDARRTASLLMPMIERDGVTRRLTAWDMEDNIEQMLVFLARYMHQPVSELEARTMGELNRWFAITRDFVMAERGVSEDAGDSDDT